MRRSSIVLATILSVVALAAIVVGGYQLGWWLKEERVNRNAEIRRGSFEYQETRRDEIIRQATTLSDLDVQIVNPDLKQEQVNALRAQREAIVDQLCNLAGDVIGDVSPTVNQILAEECL